MQASQFIRQLQEQVQAQLALARAEFNQRSTVQLQARPAPEQWSALECLEHLNRYCRYYLPAFQQALTVAAPGAATAEVRFSWVGRKSYETVRPENHKAYKTLARMNPSHSQLHRAVLDEFLQHQAQLLELLAAATRADLNRKAVPIEFFRLLKLRLGEALQFVVAHQQRHIAQAQRALALTSAPLTLAV